MEKLDLIKTYKSYYKAKTKPEIVHFDAVNYLSITGVGDPSGEEFAQKIAALYPVAYTIKFDCKADGNDFVLPKLEGLWSFDLEKYEGITMENAPKKIPRSKWFYRLLIRMPDFVKKEMLAKAKETVKGKKGDIPFLQELSWHTMNEGKCVQMLHVGPFDTEPESLIKIQNFCKQHGFQKNGEHHEIYLSDFRKTAPEKLKTILREPVR
ncbi:GyrI-like domain-containing protein [uncultured Arcticibacterium sp.]|uniref:GyrI-like domain-containing protein n=1 Tax=uncultured Arcticibacterium sp. TaxID=2173042 RepID=UPI0030F79903